MICFLDFLCEDMTAKQKANFYKKVQSSKIRFKYRKQDGSVRKAYGTLMASEIKANLSNDDKNKKINNVKRRFPKDSVFYFDLDKKGFRSFKMKNFIKYIYPKKKKDSNEK